MDGASEKGKIVCQLCVDELRKRNCDFSLLFWLRNLESLPGTDIGNELLTFLKDVSVPVELFSNSKFKNDFFSHLRIEFNSNGLQKIAPENFVVACGVGGKLRAIHEAARAKWPRPNQTFCFQTRGVNSAFFIFQCWQDGVREILRLLANPSYTDPEGSQVKVEQIYEHSWGDTRLSRLLIDWEIESPWVSGRRTPEQLRITAEKFPVWFVKQLVKTNSLDPDAHIHCTVKDKSREIERGTKVSFHFAFNITGGPKGSHQMACSRVIQPVLTKLKEIAKSKNLNGLSDAEIDQPWIGIDWRTLSGSHGFSVPFSRKKPHDPYPSVPYKMVIHRAKDDEWIADRKDFSWKDMEHSFATLGEEKCLKIFYHASYTPPAADSVSYLRLCSTPSLIQTGAYLYNSIHDRLNRGKEQGDKKSLVMARVSNMPCPVHLDMKPSKLHIHPSNGVFIAVDKEVVYCSCSECKFEEDRQVKGGSLNLVKGTEGQKYGWAIITKDLYNTLISSASVTGEPCPIPAACSCVWQCNRNLALFRWSAGGIHMG